MKALAVILFAATITGCADSSRIDELQAQINEQHKQIEMLTNIAYTMESQQKELTEITSKLNQQVKADSLAIDHAQRNTQQLIGVMAGKR